MRTQAPVSWSTAHGGFWVVTGHEPALDGLASYQSFTSTTGPSIPADRSAPATSRNPPEHGLYRVRSMTPTGMLTWLADGRFPAKAGRGGAGPPTPASHAGHRGGGPK
ncbi:hypothetical protein [Nocardia miyunensis]|uniref:hypothetical protein n=1 Tax=Nocardia miyunensis TaxID=282684 RepID=UPI0014720955|nr:hypothetical protein [Nocardia miyunensis]